MLRGTLAAVRYAWRWGLQAPRHTGEFLFGPADAEPLVFGVFGDSVGCGLGIDSVERTFAGTVARRLAERRRVVCRIRAVSGTRGRGLAIQEPMGDERFAAVSIGSNDVIHGESLSQLERLLCAFLERLRHAERVVVLGPGDLALAAIVPPFLRGTIERRVRSCEEVLKRAASRFANASHIGPRDIGIRLDRPALAPDGFHPNERSHAAIAAVVFERLMSARPA